MASRSLSFNVREGLQDVLSTSRARSKSTKNIKISCIIDGMYACICLTFIDILHFFELSSID